MRVNRDRLWNRQQEVGAIGAVPELSLIHI